MSTWLKNEAEWREQWAQADKQCDRKAKRVRQTEHPEVSEMMDLWVSKAMNDKILLTGEVLRQKWNAFANLVGIPDDERLSLSDGWLTRFKERNGLKEMKRHGEAASTSAETVERERKRIQELIEKYGYELRNIFNMDETGLFYGYAPLSILFFYFSLTPTCRMAPDRGLSNHKQSGVKGKKVRLTYAFTSNADGSEKLPPFVIGKAARPRAFNKKSGQQLGFRYRNNAKAWMTAHLYQDWIQEWDRNLQGQGRKILLFQDNFSGHIVPDNLQNIRVENFEPNLTAHVQPKDQGIIRCFKAHYRARFIQRAVDCYDEGISPAQIYDINQLQAMRLADLAWRDVDTTTIRNCWRKAGILPESDSTPSRTELIIPVSSLLQKSSQMNPAAEAERQVEAALDDLVATGALQKTNRMDIEALLNPEGESQILTEASDKEIYQSVMDAIKARENIDINGGDDVDAIQVPTDPFPTHRDVLKAVSTIRRYIEDLNDPIARKMEALLGTFNMKIRLDESRVLKNTVLTDFFQKS